MTELLSILVLKKYYGPDAVMQGMYRNIYIMYKRHFFLRIQELVLIYY